MWPNFLFLHVAEGHSKKDQKKIRLCKYTYAYPMLTYSLVGDCEDKYHMLEDRRLISNEKRAKRASYLFPFTLQYLFSSCIIRKNVILHALPVLVLLNHIGFQVGALCLTSTLLSLNLHAHLTYCLDHAHWLFPLRMIENSPMNSSIAFDHPLMLLQCTSEGT